VRVPGDSDMSVEGIVSAQYNPETQQMAYLTSDGELLLVPVERMTSLKAEIEKNIDKTSVLVESQEDGEEWEWPAGTYTGGGYNTVIPNEESELRAFMYALNSRPIDYMVLMPPQEGHWPGYM